VALLTTGVLVGTMLVTSPAGAHFQASISHIAAHMKQFFYTKSQSDARYVKGKNFLFKLGPGQQKVIAKNGAVSLIAQCHANVAGNDRVRVIAKTTQDGAVLGGSNFYSGAPGSTLDTTTLADNRVLRAFQVAANTTSVSRVIDAGFVMAPNGKMVSIDTETLALGLNYGGRKCIIGGVAISNG
jgi:hypothetical protein